MTKLAPGMTVQLGPRYGGEEGRRTCVAHCVRCGWTSAQLSWTRAKALASRADSHVCGKIATVTGRMKTATTVNFRTVMADFHDTWSKLYGDVLREEEVVRDFYEKDRIADIEARMRDLETELRALKRFPDDDFAEGTVIRFELKLKVGVRDYDRVISERAFTYAALKAGDLWWITGQPLVGEELTQRRGGVKYGVLRQILTKAENVRLFAGDGEPLAREDRAASEVPARTTTKLVSRSEPGEELPE